MSFFNNSIFSVTSCLNLLKYFSFYKPGTNYFSQVALLLFDRKWHLELGSGNQGCPLLLGCMLLQSLSSVQNQEMLSFMTFYYKFIIIPPIGLQSFYLISLILCLNPMLENLVTNDSNIIVHLFPPTVYAQQSQDDGTNSITNE